MNRTSAGGYLIRSTDGGQHWQAVANLPRSAGIYQLLLSPHYAVDHTFVVHFGDGSVWRSPDAGATWVRADHDLGNEQGNPVYSLALAPLGAGSVAMVAATKAAAVISLDWGQTWYLLDWKTFSRIAVPPDFSQSLTVYGIEPNTSHLLQSTDLGATWVEPLPGQLLSWVAFGPGDGQHSAAYTGGADGLWRSLDGGQSWSMISGRPVAAGGLIRQLIVSPDFEHDGTVLALHEEPGARQLRTTDGGRHWSVLALPGAGNGVLAMASDRRLFLTRGPRLYVSTSLGSDWQEVTAALPFEPSLLTISPAYATDQTLLIGNYGGGVYRSTSGGTSWALITAGVPPFVTDLDLSPGYPSDGTIFISTYNTGLYRTVDGGSHWINLTSPKFSPDFAVTLSPAYPADQTLFVGANGISDGGAFRSEDGGATWINITHDQITTFVGGQAVSPRFAEDRTIVMAPDFGPVYLSEDAGDTWFPLSGLPGAGQFARHYLLDLTYTNGYLQPISAVLDSVYTYQWPSLPAVPTVIGTGLLTGTTGTVSFTLPLAAEAYGAAGVPWSVEGGADWLSLLPVSGTLPAQLVLEVNADLLGGARSLDLTLRRYLSQRQVDVTRVQARVFWVTDQAWLPLTGKNAAVSRRLSAALTVSPTLLELLTAPDHPRFEQADRQSTDR